MLVQMCGEVGDNNKKDVWHKGLGTTICYIRTDLLGVSQALLTGNLA